MKQCTKCSLHLPETHFKKWSRICKPCLKIRSKTYTYIKYLPDLRLSEKFCKKCKSIVSINNFDKKTTNYDGYAGSCKQHYKQARHKYYLKTKEQSRNYKRRYYTKIENKQRKNKNSAINHKERSKVDMLYVMKRRLRNRLYYALHAKNWKKNNNLSQYLGCEYSYFRQFLESKFTNGMNWDVFLQGKIHIDHIIPLSSAKTEEDLYKLCHYSNLQPLWALDNLSKANKY